VNVASVSGENFAEQFSGVVNFFGVEESIVVIATLREEAAKRGEP
jgi:hypothetical protein